MPFLRRRKSKNGERSDIPMRNINETNFIQLRQQQIQSQSQQQSQSQPQTETHLNRNQTHYVTAHNLKHSTHYPYLVQNPNEPENPTRSASGNKKSHFFPESALLHQVKLSHHTIPVRNISQGPKKILQWFYSFSLVILLLLFIGLNSIIPIDSIIKSKTSSNLAINAIVIVIACCLFIGLSISTYILRIIVLEFYLMDIPKPYMPTTPRDIPSDVSRYIKEELIRCEEIREKSKPNKFINHPGLYHDNSGIIVEEDDDDYDDGKDNKSTTTSSSSLLKSSDDESDFAKEIEMKGINLALPNHLIYENVIRSIGEGIKYNGSLIFDKDEYINVPINKNFREIFELLIKRLNEIYQSNKNTRLQNHNTDDGDSDIESEKLQYQETQDAKLSEKQDGNQKGVRGVGQEDEDYEIKEITELILRFMDHYEYLRFSGKPITYQDFVKFMIMWIEIKKQINRFNVGPILY
ncbi:hypothetical protein B5S30_g760 [[Candida] boidinii]|nr:hypothetical protein B5S30_g760 [[Candida] boidinii]GMF98600.1 unnamed protein product [[Candida] boidinii]